MASLPIVDVSPLIAREPKEIEVARALDAACQTHGFFYVRGHGVPEDLVRGLAEASRRFFDRPRDDKMAMRMALGGAAWRGYFPVGGELWVHPELSLPLHVDFEDDLFAVRADPEVQVSLAGAPVGPGETIELLALDRARFEHADGRAWELEVEAP